VQGVCFGYSNKTLLCKECVLMMPNKVAEVLARWIRNLSMASNVGPDALLCRPTRAKCVFFSF
jgi:hypothetical protein